MEQEPIYYKSDFDFLLPLKDAEGNAIGWPGHDWGARFTTAGNLRGYTAGCTGGVCRNCVRDGDGIRIIADRHGLPPGRVMCEMTVRVPDSRYPDGTRSVAGLYELDIRLTDEPGKAVVSGEIRLPVIGGEARALPFLFTDEYRGYGLGAVFFNRELGRFIQEDGSDAPAPYNERLADGTAAASRERRFACGGKEYRFTGSQLVNTEIERNPDRRLVRRCPTVDAHPGLAYIDRGMINVPLGLPGSGEFAVSVAGMFFRKPGTDPIPLSSLIPVGSSEVRDLRFEGDILCGSVVAETGSPGSCNHVRLLTDCSHVPDSRATDGRMTGSRSGWYIGIRYDNGGRKIFYRFNGSFPDNEAAPPTLGEAESAIRAGVYGNRIGTLDNVSAGPFQAQVWLRRRNYGTKRVYARWFPLNNQKTVQHKRCLVRLRRVTAAGVSDWAYFHVSLLADGINIRPSRQQRLL